MTQTSDIFSTGINDAGRNGLNISLHQISSGSKNLCLASDMSAKKVSSQHCQKFDIRTEINFHKL